MHNQTSLALPKKTIIDTLIKVYNFTVEDEHNYFVGNNKVLVHNTCPPRGLWELTEGGSSAIKRHSKYGKIFKSKSDDLWWAVDNAEHGGSKFKVFKESSKGLEWYRDADQFGDFIINKHKGPIGTSIPWGQLQTIK